MQLQTFLEASVLVFFGEEDGGKDERSGREREYLELREKRRRRSFCDARCFPVTKTVVSSRNSLEEEEEEGRCDSQSLMRRDTTIRL